MTKKDDTIANAKIPCDLNKEDTSIAPCIFSRMWVFLLIFLIGIAGTTLTLKLKPELFDMKAGKETGLMGFNTENNLTSERLKALSNRVNTLESRVRTLETNEPEAVPAAPKDDFSKLKEGVKTLFETSENIGSKLEVALTEALQGRKSMQTSVASVMAYMQLKDKALDGVTFSDALKNMQNLSGSNAEIKATLDKLKVYANKGISTRVELYQEWLKIAPTVTNQVRQDQAKTWKERVTVALGSLVSVKSLKEDGASNLAIAGLNDITSDLERGSINAALKKVGNFSERIKQDVMMSWVEKARDYVAVETLLADISKAMMFPSTQNKKTSDVVLDQEKTELKKEGKK